MHSKPLTLITGASAGIGHELAKQLAEKNHRLILIARRKDRLDKLVSQLNTTEKELATPVTLDLADLDKIAPAITEIQSTLGPITNLVNNAGYNLYQSTLDLPLDQHHQIMNVNYFAPLYLIRAILPTMLEQKCGHIINIASIATKLGPPNHSTYAAAKSALVSLTQSLACEHQQTNVNFSYVNPGLVKTEFFDSPTYKPMQKYLNKHGISPRRVAEKIVKLFDRPKLELCVPAHFRALDYIKALSPGLALKIVANATRDK